MAEKLQKMVQVVVYRMGPTSSKIIGNVVDMSVILKPGRNFKAK